MMLKGIIAVIAIIAGGYASAFFLGFTTHAAEPDSRTLVQQGEFSQRLYPKMLVAEVQVSGERQQALREGFKLLADFIFGNNTAQSGRKGKVNMTIPVLQSPNKKVKMTAPVLQSSDRSNKGAHACKSGKEWWAIDFVMPAEYTLKTLPKPNNNKVKIIERPARRYAVVTFSGRPTTKLLHRKELALVQYTQANKLKRAGSTVYAFYNPPWVLPFMRRNEVMIPIK